MRNSCLSVCQPCLSVCFCLSACQPCFSSCLTLLFSLSTCLSVSAFIEQPLESVSKTKHLLYLHSVKDFSPYTPYFCICPPWKQCNNACRCLLSRYVPFGDPPPIIIVMEDVTLWTHSVVLCYEFILTVWPDWNQCCIPGQVTWSGKTSWFYCL